MVEAMVHVSRAYQLLTVAEHVEDERDCQILRDIGVDFVQGYAVGKPQIV